MQHLDEGTIHSWLDGVLSAEESARVRSHVEECPQCGSAVAEARGFIAASSRILTALDHAPRGVVPGARPRKRVDPFVWRVAATVLVVAAGTLAVVNNRGVNESRTSALVDSVIAVPQEASATASASPLLERAKVPANGTGATSAIANPSSNLLSRKAETKTVPVPAAAPAPAPSTRSATAMDLVASREPLKVVGTPHRIGSKITLYEIAPGDTVTLAESLPMRLEEAVVTSAEAASMEKRAAEKSAAAPPRSRVDVARTAAADSPRASGVVQAVPMVTAAAPSRQQTANTVNTITWTDSATGSRFSLSGRMPEKRLQEIRIRIERERAAAKKNP